MWRVALFATAQKPFPRRASSPQPGADYNKQKISQHYVRYNSCHDFDITIICALPLEANTASLFDRRWDDHGPTYKVPGDPNAYSSGVLSHHNAVLVHMPSIGTNNAAAAVTTCCISFPNICLAIIVGICGGIPNGTDGREIVLGDVVISHGVIQYDFDRQLPDGFAPMTISDSLGRPNNEIHALLAKLTGLHEREQMRDKTAYHLERLHVIPALEAGYPSAKHDRLFEAAYRHLDPDASCEQAGCKDTLVVRNRLVSAEADCRPGSVWEHGDEVRRGP